MVRRLGSLQGWSGSTGATLSGGFHQHQYNHPDKKKYDQPDLKNYDQRECQNQHFQHPYGIRRGGHKWGRGTENISFKEGQVSFQIGENISCKEQNAQPYPLTQRGKRILRHPIATGQCQHQHLQSYLRRSMSQ